MIESEEKISQTRVLSHFLNNSKVLLINFWPKVFGFVSLLSDNFPFLRDEIVLKLQLFCFSSQKKQKGKCAT